MSKCLNPYRISVGIKKDKNLTFTGEQLSNFPELKKLDLSNKKNGVILAPCGKCYNCRLNRARDWTVRTIHEYSRKEFFGTHMYFFTLTYDPAHLGNNSLDYRDVQLFLKRLRKLHSDSTLKFLCVGEYGFKSGRKHWHLIIFGFNKKIKYGAIHRIWEYGNVDIDLVRSFSAVSYLLKYAFKDYKIDKKKYIVDGRTPPLFRCSKGYGKEFAERNINDVMKLGYIQYNNYKFRIPRFYREIYYKMNFIDGWREYDINSSHLTSKMLDELALYGFSVDFTFHNEFDSLYLISYYLDKMRPIYKEINEQKYENYFKKFIEKI